MKQLIETLMFINCAGLAILGAILTAAMLVELEKLVHWSRMRRANVEREAAKRSLAGDGGGKEQG